VFADGPSGETREIRALAGMPPIEDVNLGQRSLTEAVLGGLASKEVTFGPNGRSQPVLFEITGNLSNAPVGKWPLLWTWQERANPDAQWTQWGVTRHDVCVIIDMPNPPWTNDPDDPEGWSLPWISALEKACAWAAGTTTVTESQEAIARAINGISQQCYVTQGTLAELKPARFKLAEYIHRLDSGLRFTMNCRDIASAVISFANILGSDLWPLGMLATDTNPVRALSATTFGPQSWTFHEIAVPRSVLPLDWDEEEKLEPGGPDGARIYDACIHLPGNVPPLNMAFGNTAAAGTYRFRLIKPNGHDGVDIKPRTQRKVI
jgi:hypothetical protein